jgi:flagellar biosynthetic protein FliR
MQAAQGQAAQIRTETLGSTGNFTADVVSFFGPSSQLWLFGLVFLRMTSVIMLIPGIGDAMVPPRVRIVMGFMLALILAPVVKAQLPALPADIGTLLGLALHELFVGLILGGLMRAFLYALSVVGEVMSLQTTLSFSQTTNPGLAQSSTSIATFLSILGLTLVYATGTHQLFFRAMADSYQLFSPLKPLMLGDANTLMVRAIGQSFALAIQLSAPVIVFALVLNVATGFVGRLMPGFPIFFAATPLLVLAGFSLIAMTLGGLGLVFIEHYQAFLGLFIRAT